MREWKPGERLSYYAGDNTLCDDRGTAVADVYLTKFGEFAEAAAKLAEWLNDNSDAFYEAMATVKGPAFDEMFRRMTHLRGLVATRKP